MLEVNEANQLKLKVAIFGKDALRLDALDHGKVGIIARSSSGWSVFCGYREQRYDGKTVREAIDQIVSGGSACDASSCSNDLEILRARLDSLRGDARRLDALEKGSRFILTSTAHGWSVLCSYTHQRRSGQTIREALDGLIEMSEAWSGRSA